MASAYGAITSPVPHIIGSNEPPSDAELAIIRETIEISDNNMVQLNRDIISAEIALAEMKKRYHQLRTHRQVHAALLTPMRRLPVELLAAIFEACLPDRPDRNLRDPLTLAGVCRRWRIVAVSTGRLWSRMEIYLQTVHPQSQANQVGTWLLRSGGCPLSIKIRFMGKLKEHPVIDALLAYAHHWADIDICVPSALFDAFSPAIGRMLELRHIKLRSTDNQHFEPNGLSVFATAPRLRSAILHVPPDQVLLPWDQLKECTVSANISPLLYLLERTTSLDRCVIESCLLDLAGGPPPSAVVSNLKSLQVRHHLLDIGSVIVFDCLTLPHLTDLSIQLLNQTQWRHLSLMSFLQRAEAGSRLRRLALLRLSFRSFADLVDVLEALPSLSELEMNWVYIVDGSSREPIPNNELLMRMTHSNGYNTVGKTMLLPQLTAIHISGLLQCHDDYLLDMIQSRWHDPPSFASRVRDLTLKYRREWDRQAIAKLERLADEGLNLSIQQMPIDMSGPSDMAHDVGVAF